MPVEEIWSKILQKAASSKSIPIKNLIVLGDSKSGKSTLLRALGMTLPELESCSFEPCVSEQSLAYSYFDIVEEEDTVIRIGMYQLPGNIKQSYLIETALTIDRLHDSLVVIVLDWSKPWDFIPSLLKWLKVLEEYLSKMALKQPAMLDDLKSKVKMSWVDADDDILQNNLGIPLIFVCTKSDCMNILERDCQYTEDRFDYIQQCVRSVALQYGASVCYTSTHKVATFFSLRRFLIKLFCSDKGVEINEPEVLERDIVWVPFGWDSWGKIKALCSQFESEAVKTFESHVKRPSNISQPLTLSNQVIAKDEQQLLGELHQSLNSSPDGGMANTYPLEDISAKLEKLSKQSPSTPIKQNYSLETATPVTSRDGLIAPSPSAQNEVLANFFQSLLNKKAGSTPSKKIFAL